jgi:hypothetical protein
LRQAISEGLKSIQRTQEPDAYWRSVYSGGPTHVSAGLVATLLLEKPTAARFGLEKPLVESLCALQSLNGGFCAYPGGPPSTDVTRLVLLSLRLFQETYPVQPDVSGLSRGTLPNAIRRAKHFIDTDRRPSDGVFLKLFADLFWDAAYPDESHSLPAQPLSAEACALLLQSSWTEVVRRRIASFSRQAIPALGVLFEHAASRHWWVRWGDRVADAFGLNSSLRSLQFLEREILKNQARTGGWLWSVLGTSLNLLALRALGHDDRHGAVRRGLDFIHRLRSPGEDGTLVQSWCNAELWDSSVCGTVLRFCDVNDFEQAKLSAQLVREQASDGLWGFGTGALEGDNDSSSAVLTFLTRTAAGLPSARALETTASVQRAVDALLAGQQQDGGWGYSPEPHEAPYSFGPRSPFGLESTLVDGSTPDVTGRILGSLLSARATGLLETQPTSRIDEAWRKGLEYFRATQAGCGSWQGRWTAGYLSPLVFILPMLRAGGQAMAAPWVSRAEAFVRARQNPDGGWGESTRADEDAQVAGRGASTPVQTAYALSALVACSSPQSLAADTALARGVEYLLTQQTAGRWNNGRALYTVAFRDDYFDAPLMTQTMVVCVLRYVTLAREVGPQRASERFVLGDSRMAPGTS